MAALEPDSINYRVYFIRMKSLYFKPRRNTQRTNNSSLVVILFE